MIKYLNAFIHIFNLTLNYFIFQLIEFMKAFYFKIKSALLV